MATTTTATAATSTVKAKPTVSKKDQQKRIQKRRDRGRCVARNIVRGAQLETKLVGHKKLSVALLRHMFATNREFIVKAVRAGGEPDAVEVAFMMEYLQSAEEAALSAVITPTPLTTSTDGGQ